MERVTSWGVVLDETIPESVTATYQGQSATEPSTPAVSAVGRWDAIKTVVARVTYERDGAPSPRDVWRARFCFYIWKVLAYQRAIAIIDAQYPNINQAPLAVRRERAALVLKLARLQAIRDNIQTRIDAGDGE